MNLKYKPIPPYQASERISSEERLPDLSHPQFLFNIQPIKRLFNPNLLHPRILVLAKELNNQVSILQQTFVAKQNPIDANTNPEIHGALILKHQASVEISIYLMKQIINSIIQALYCKNNPQPFEKTNKLEFSGIEDIFDSKKKDNLFVKDILRLTENEKKLLEAIKDINNSYKHCILTSESMNQAGASEPTVSAFYIPFNDLSRDISIYEERFNEIWAGFLLFFKDKYSLITK